MERSAMVRTTFDRDSAAGQQYEAFLVARLCDGIEADFGMPADTCDADFLFNSITTIIPNGGDPDADPVVPEHFIVEKRVKGSGEFTYGNP